MGAIAVPDPRILAHSFMTAYVVASLTTELARVSIVKSANAVRSMSALAARREQKRMIIPRARGPVMRRAPVLAITFDAI